ncbi:MAG TPA: ABC transporter substrate-binding protein [Candidatus Binatia bacterium]|nr:ABC transporter substrate-binding protein [Candidatus Binatia bacterium]
MKQSFDILPGSLLAARRIFAAVFFALCSMLVAPCFPAEAQQPMKIPRIGFLSATSPSAIAARVEAFRRGLRELGYVEGKNIVIEWRYAEGKLDRLGELAAELVRLKVDVIVSAGPPPTRTAKQATATIPVVMAMDTDPVGNGFVASLARPGGNITGLSTLFPEISGKRLELLNETFPNLFRVAVLGTSTSPSYSPMMREIEVAAKALKLQVQYLDVFDSKDIDTAFRAANKARAQALLTLGSPILDSERAHVANRAIENRLPAIYPQIEYTEAGGLMYYGANTPELFRHAATYVDKILKGAKPADLPVEQPTKFELVINSKTAKQIGLTIPPNVLARADKVIR